MHDAFNSTWFINMGIFNNKKLLTLLAQLENSDKPNPGIEKYLFRILSVGILHKIFKFKNY